MYTSIGMHTSTLMYTSIVMYTRVVMYTTRLYVGSFAARFGMVTKLVYCNLSWGDVEGSAPTP